MLEVTKNAPQMAIIQLGDAFKRFFKGQYEIYNQLNKNNITAKALSVMWLMQTYNK